MALQPRLKTLHSAVGKWVQGRCSLPGVQNGASVAVPAAITSPTDRNLILHRLHATCGLPAGQPCSSPASFTDADRSLSSLFFNTSNNIDATASLGSWFQHPTVLMGILFCFFLGFSIN